MRFAIIIMTIFALAFVACGETSAGRESREQSIEGRDAGFARAEALHPAPILQNFPAREALVEFSERQDMLDHPWYVYILSDMGSVIGYYVAQTRPVNSCTFLSSTEDVEDYDDSELVLTAPSLDGIFYGGAGASAGCDAWFFFDSATDAMVEIRGVKFFTADQPLLLEAEPIRIGSAP